MSVFFPLFVPPCLNLTSGWVYAPEDFSNILSKTAIERLADVDEYEVVREVQVSPLHIVPLRRPTCPPPAPAVNITSASA